MARNLQDKSRDYHLRRTYSITLEQYEYLLKQQDYKCGVCKRHHSEFKTNLAVDHDHVTKEIRGLLCTFCNRRVIGRHRSAELFANAAEYLRKGTGWFVLANRGASSKKKKRRKKPASVRTKKSRRRRRTRK